MGKRLSRKRTLVLVLSVGFLILGLVSITWSIYDIWAQTHYSSQISVPPQKDSTTKKIIEDNYLESKTSNPLTPIDNPLYSLYPLEGDNIGTLTIPDLQRNLAIFQGTREKELKKGVGHFIQSVLPGENDNCVISGHRETTFRQLDKLKLGNLIIVQTSAGTFTYEVSNTRIVNKDDKTVIVPTKTAVLTMTTCYPFNFIGDAPDRYIVSAVLVKIE